MKKYSKKELFRIEKSIVFLVKHITKSNSNPKPLILHCVNVGTKLLELKLPVDIIVAGILHDLVEDTKCTLKNIEEDFGKKVAIIVSALTQDYKYEIYQERWHNAEKRINKIGKYGWLIKMIDARDNLPYYYKILTNTKKKKEKIYEMMWKHNMIIGHARNDWSKLAEFKDYNKLSTKIKKKWKIKF